MTYFGFLLVFLGIPLTVLGLLRWSDIRAGRLLPAPLRTWPLSIVISAHVIIALVYTTPWDNYLVATGVWWYDPALVTGIVIGWVPIEEYTFFVVQTIATGLFLAVIAVRLRSVRSEAEDWASRPMRYYSTGLLAAFWLGSAAMLVSGWRPGTYLALELVWALPPVMLQFAFGADILWRYRNLVLWTLVPATLYLIVADAIAIYSGTWTIDPAQSTGVMFGPLPLEEAVFFLATNTLVVFGVVLVLAEESQARAPKAITNLLRRISGPMSPAEASPAQRSSHST